jgi:hypothetical protein
MNELSLQFISSLKIVWIAGFSFFYGWGGISGKWKRRFIGTAWMMLGMVVFSLWLHRWNYWFLFYLPLSIGALSLGYGATDTATKIKKRMICGSALGFSACPLAIVNQMWALWALHLVVCILFSVTLGVWNITKNARSEETIIATIGALLPLFMI